MLQRHYAPRTLFALLAGAALLALAALPAGAQTWSEVGDAGDLPATAQVTVGSGPLTTITGTFSSPDDVDLYCIHVDDPIVFYAGILCASFTDPDIWLFKVNGQGVEHNDVCQAGSTSVNGTFVPGPGNYLLGVAYGGRQAQSAGGAMWQTELFTGQRTPDGPGAAGTLTGWAGTGHPTPLTSYTITFLSSGTSYCANATPAPNRSWGSLKLIYR